MPPKRRPAAVTGSSNGSSSSNTNPSIEARMVAVNMGLKKCRSMVDKLTEKQKAQYRFLNGVLCEIAPGLYDMCDELITKMCAAHTMSTNVNIMSSLQQLESLRDQLKVMIGEKTSSPAQIQSYLQQMEMHTAMALQNGPPEEHLNPEVYQEEVRRNLETFRNRIYPILPAVTPEHRANVITHVNPKTLPASYFEHIDASLEEPHRAEALLKKAAKEVPSCHIAWRLLGLGLLQQLPSTKTKKIDRIAQNLAPLTYLAKVVELLPKDFRTWWHIAKHLYRTEVDYVGDEKLRSLIFTTINGKKYSSWDCFARVLELEPNVPYFWFYLGQSMLRSHQLFAKEECVVNIAFERGPTMTEVSARYCYEAYIRISPPTEFISWLHVANAMLNEREVTADVDDGFTSIELDTVLPLSHAPTYSQG